MKRVHMVVVLLGVALAACNRAAAPTAAAATPTLDVTNWTDKSELFMEYPPFVAGHGDKVS